VTRTDCHHEAQIRQFVSADIALGGYRVAANGMDALQEITRHPIEFVILDLTLPATNAICRFANAAAFAMKA
jgi:DNA-binding response OmpR family regulator